MKYEAETDVRALSPNTTGCDACTQILGGIHLTSRASEDAIFMNNLADLGEVVFIHRILL